jgi:hypothetical protein
MSMRWKGFTPDMFVAELERASTETRRDSKKVMRAGAKEILETSQQQAPVDDGELEKAHELTVVKLNRDDMEVEITVGGIVDGVDVDTYAWEMHEFQTPYGDIPLGPKSQEKNDSNPPGRFVGGKFLERAVDEHEEGIVAAVANTLPGD